MKSKFFSICGLILFCLGVSAQNNIAVYVVCEDNIPQSYAKVVGTALTNAVNSDGYFVAVERTNEFLQASNSEVAYQNSGAVSQSQILELGKQFGANYVFTVDLSEVLGEMYASSRILNVASNTVEAVGDESAVISTLEQLRTFSKNIAQNTMAKLPHNVEKKKIEDLHSHYSVYIPDTFEQFYNYWRRGRWDSSYEDAEEYLKTCKALNLPSSYDVIYSIELDKDEYVSKYETHRTLLVKTVDKYGNEKRIFMGFPIDSDSNLVNPKDNYLMEGYRLLFYWLK